MAPPTALSICLTTGHLHQGKPIGEYDRIGTSTLPRTPLCLYPCRPGDLANSSRAARFYYTKPPAGSKGRDWENVVMLLSDVLGLGNQNTLLLADNFAANGYTVIVPDLFRGDAVPYNYPASYDMAAWQARHPPKDVMEVVQSVVWGLREKAHSRCKQHPMFFTTPSSTSPSRFTPVTLHSRRDGRRTLRKLLHGHLL